MLYVGRSAEQLVEIPENTSWRNVHVSHVSDAGREVKVTSETGADARMLTGTSGQQFSPAKFAAILTSVQAPQEQNKLAL